MGFQLYFSHNSRLQSITLNIIYDYIFTISKSSLFIHFFILCFSPPLELNSRAKSFHSYDFSCSFFKTLVVTSLIHSSLQFFHVNILSNIIVSFPFKHSLYLATKLEILLLSLRNHVTHHPSLLRSSLCLCLNLGDQSCKKRDRKRGESSWLNGVYISDAFQGMRTC